MNEIVYPDFEAIVDRLLNYNTWHSMEPFPERIIRELKDAYNKGRSRGLIEGREERSPSDILDKLVEENQLNGMYD